jgi:hypothetical protein
MSTTIHPSLKLRKTVNDPFDPDVVFGFHGRDTTYGRKSVILKGDAQPPEADNDPYFYVPRDLATDIAADNLHVYILGDEVVYAIEGTRFWDHQRPIDVDRDDDTETFSVVHASQFNTHDRDDVEVTN